MKNNTDLEILWSRCLSFIEGKIGNSAFELWFKPIKLVDLKGDMAVFLIPNRFFIEWIEDNYPHLICETFEKIVSKKIYPTYQIDQARTKEGTRKNEAVNAKKLNYIRRGIHLNPRYTFEHFVVGPSNQFVHAAAMAVSESLGKTYNPLFIYGDVGLGKTHLLSAIGNRVIDTMSDMSILYVSSEQFTNEVVAAIRHEKMSDLKEKYRNVDVLLLDDVQFIASKTQTQEEFFHTFNALYEKQKQIVISSDRPPKEISAVTDRLKSRFTMGLIADIQPPSVEMKIAIIQKKAENEQIQMPDEVSYFLATRIRSNIRELEGCLIKLSAYCTLTGNPIDIHMAKHVLKDVFIDEVKQITIDHIQKEVCEYYGLRKIDIKAKKRTKEIALPRQVAMYISKKLTDLSLSDIGREFGGKDHATVIYACKQIEKKRESNDSFNRIVEHLMNKIKP